MSPARRRAPRPSPSRGTVGGRRGVLRRRDLEILLDQLDAAGSRTVSTARRDGRGRSDPELARLRALVAKAIAEEDQADDDHEEIGDDDWSPKAWGAGSESETDDTDDWESDDWDSDDWEGWSPRGPWEHFGPSKPIRVEGGLRVRTRRGAIGSTWWSKRFLAAIESVMVGGRLGRGRTYARRGQVLDLVIAPGMIEAGVQGSRSTPYRVRLAMPVIPEADWDLIVAALGAQAGYAARMLAGDLPAEVEELFSAEGASLLPAPNARLTTDCSCPDWANPCKHVAAVCYLVAEEFDREPFAILRWRGRDRDALLGQLRQLRSASADVRDVKQEPFTAVPTVEAPPLRDCLLGYWKAGPELAGLHVRPEPTELPDAVLRHPPAGLIDVRGRDLGEVLAPAYADLTGSVAHRALGKRRYTR